MCRPLRRQPRHSVPIVKRKLLTVYPRLLDQDANHRRNLDATASRVLRVEPNVLTEGPRWKEKDDSGGGVFLQVRARFE